jgi:thiamine pyrophosphokinase
MENRIAIIFLNGELPGEKLIKKYSINKFYKICADGAANSLINTDIQPDVIIGDFDSITKIVSNYYERKGTTLLKISEQETTDFEKSLNYGISVGFNEFIIFGAISRRPDHTFNNFSVAKRYYRTINLLFVDNVFEIEFIIKKIKFKYLKNQTVSLLPFPYAKRVKTMGLKYRLKDEDLELGVREGTLNVSTAKNIIIEFVSGDLLLFKKHFLNKSIVN